MEKKQPKVEVSCNYCQTKFMKKASNLRASPISYCSTDCLSLFKKHKYSSIIKCNYCQSTFLKTKKEISISKIHYCSIDCYGNSNKKGKFVPCTRCLKSIYISPFKFKLKKHFCNVNCKNLTSKNKSKKPKTIGVKRNKELINISNYRNKALKYYKNECQNKYCQLKPFNVSLKKVYLDIDHIDGDRTNNKISNLCILCVLCHRIKTLKKVKIILEQHEN